MNASLDSIFFTERICGICSTAHAMASTMALENALGVTPTLNDSYIRDIMHGFEFLQNHIRQFYYYTIPSYVKMPDVNPLQPQEYKDYRLPQKLNARLIESYEKSVLISRLAHEGLAVLGGKIPHSHGIFVGGVTVNIDPYKLTKIKSIISEIYSFIDNRMIEDVNILAQYYADYFEKGNSYENFILNMNLKDVRFNNLYKSCVTLEGNLRAQSIIKEIFTRGETYWRGIGKIENSGFFIKEKYRSYDAVKKFNLSIDYKNLKDNCICSEIILGNKEPNQCNMFKKYCTPENPLGSCMVSREGSCLISYKYS